MSRDGPTHVKKAAGSRTTYIVDEFGLVRLDNHEHCILQGFNRIRAAQVCPHTCCRVICKGLAAQKVTDAMGSFTFGNANNLSIEDHKHAVDIAK